MKYLSATLIILFAPILLQAQHLEVGVFLGASTYQGDLAPSTFQLSTTQYHPAIGVYVRPEVTEWLAVRLSAHRGKITGTDEKALNYSRRKRNTHFRSDISDVEFTVEIQPAGHIQLRGNAELIPYGYAGIAYFSFNPQAELDGLWYDLQPLNTEGQGTSAFPEKEPYELQQFAVPLGGGVKIKLWGLLKIGLDLGFRKTFTDYLDDVSTVHVDREILLTERGRIAADLSNRTGEFFGIEDFSLPTGTQRGDPTDDDWYVFGGITIGVDVLTFGRKFNIYKKRRRGGVKCPGVSGRRKKFF